MLLEIAPFPKIIFFFSFDFDAKFDLLVLNPRAKFLVDYEDLNPPIKYLLLGVKFPSLS